MLKKAKFLIKEAKLRVTYKMTKDCIFCKVVSGEMNSKIIAENSGAVAINDINPVAKVHILIIPKKHIDSVLTLEETDGETLVNMFEISKQLVVELKLEAYRLSFNGGKFQHVGHVHMHLLAGSKIEWEKL